MSNLECSWNSAWQKRDLGSVIHPLIINVSVNSSTLQRGMQNKLWSSSNLSDVNTSWVNLQTTLGCKKIYTKTNSSWIDKIMTFSPTLQRIGTTRATVLDGGNRHITCRIVRSVYYCISSTFIKVKCIVCTISKILTKIHQVKIFHREIIRHGWICRTDYK